MEEDRNGCIECNPFQRAELTERKLDFSENSALRSPGRRRCGRPELARKRKKKGSTWDFWHKFLPTYTSPFEPVFLLNFSPYMSHCRLIVLAKNRSLRREKE